MIFDLIAIISLDKLYFDYNADIGATYKANLWLVSFDLKANLSSSSINSKITNLSSSSTIPRIANSSSSSNDFKSQFCILIMFSTSL